MVSLRFFFNIYSLEMFVGCTINKTINKIGLLDNSCVCNCVWRH